MSSPGELRALRVSYELGALDESSVARDPFVQFRSWLQAALGDERIVEPNAAALATIGLDGRPSARTVLLRDCDERGLTFFTNYESRKGRELEAHPAATLVFWWGVLQRQVRVDGPVERVDAAESEAYFAERPRGHQLGAWASRQSAVVPSRAYLEARVREEEERFAGREVARPPYWGGYRIVPDAFEFWQGRADRVHDRLSFTREERGWRIVRLSP
ncbi:MAG: pyridoxamine 5'-phosphate oxidase [Candidatus Baltobacteraceae bacterium]